MKHVPKMTTDVRQKSTLFGQTGQMTIEMILVAIILTGIALSFAKFARNNAIAAGLIEGPWKSLQGMIEDGVWVKSPNSQASNPNLLARHVTALGNPVTSQ